MNIIRELVTEVLGMFVGDKQLTIGVLAIVATAAILAAVSGPAPLGASLLLFGCPLLLIDNVRRSAAISPGRSAAGDRANMRGSAKRAFITRKDGHY